MTTVFVGSYSPPDQAGIHVFGLESSARFRLLATRAGIANPSFLVLDAGGRYLFAVSETALAADGVAGHVHSFRVDRGDDTLELTEIDRRPTGGDQPCHIAIDRSGKWLAVSNYGSGSVAILPRGPDGTMDDPVSLIEHSGVGGRPGRQAGPHAHSAVFAPDNRFLIVADLGIDRLMVYRFEPETGSCRPVFEAVSQPGAGPRHMVFHPDGRHLFVVNELDNTLTWWAYDPEVGSLGVVGAVSTLPGVAAENLAADIHVSTSGRHLYVSNRGHDSIAHFEFDAALGLRPRAVVASGGEGPRGFVIAPDDTHIVVAHRHSNDVVVLPVGADGEVGSSRGRTEVPNPTCVVLR